MRNPCRWSNRCPEVCNTKQKSAVLGWGGSPLTSRILGVIRNYLARSLGSRGSLRENMRNSQNPRGFLEIFNFHRFFVVLVIFVGFWMVSGTVWDTLRLLLPCRLQSRVSGTRIVVQTLKIIKKSFIFMVFGLRRPRLHQSLI